MNARGEVSVRAGMNKPTLLVLALALLPATALALPANFDKAVLKAPRMDLGERSSIAVGQLEGYRADDIRSALVSALMNGDRGPANFVEDQAGADGGILITGTVAEPEVHDEIEDVKVERKKGPVTVTETDHVLTRTVTIRFEMTAIDVATGDLRGQETFDIRMQHKGKQRTSPEKCYEHARGAEDMASELIEPFGMNIANDISPRWALEGWEVERNQDTVVGVLMAKNEQDWLAATDWFVRNAAKDPYNEWLQYNSAVLLGLTGHFEAADEHLGKARAIKDRPRYRMFAGRLEKLAREAETLDAMGHGTPPGDFAGKAGEYADADTVNVKGPAKKRFPLTESPGGGGTVVEVPGGMTLVVIGEDGGFLQVQTFDGVVGWIEAKRVK